MVTELFWELMHIVTKAFKVRYVYFPEVAVFHLKVGYIYCS